MEETEGDKMGWSQRVREELWIGWDGNCGRFAEPEVSWECEMKRAELCSKRAQNYPSLNRRAIPSASRVDRMTSRL